MYESGEGVPQDDAEAVKWFDGEPVLKWLRAAGWLGNAGNRSESAQVLPVCEDMNQDPPPGSSVSLPGPTEEQECSQDADKSSR